MYLSSTLQNICVYLGIIDLLFNAKLDAPFFIVLSLRTSPLGAIMSQSFCIGLEPPITPELPHAGDASLHDYCRNLIKAYLADCKIPFVNETLDPNVFKAACDKASEYGCCMSGPLSIVPAIKVGTLMGTACYGHRDFEIQLFMSLFTAYTVYMDDACTPDASLASKFVESFASGQPQGHPVLDALAAILLEIPQKFGKVVSNLVLTSALNLVTSWLLEAEIPRISVSWNRYHSINIYWFTSAV